MAGFPCQPFSKAGKQFREEIIEELFLMNATFWSLENPCIFILKMSIIAKHNN